MKLRKLHIKNFRALDDVEINFDAFTCLIGANGVGKSCVFAALNVLFRRPTSKELTATNLVEEDFYNRQTSTPVAITATFDSLTDAAKDALKHYVRHGELVLRVEAVWDTATKTAPIRQIGVRHVIAEFKPFFAKMRDNESVRELRALYATYRTSKPELPDVTNKADMEAALRAFEEAHQAQGAPVPSSEDFYGATGSSSILAKHLLWIHVPPVKDASSEGTEHKGSWFGQLVQHVVRSKINVDSKIEEIRKTAAAAYSSVITEQQAQLTDLSTRLSRRLQEWANPAASLSVHWAEVDEAAIQVTKPLAEVDAADGNFKGPLGRHGHGFQRSYLVSLLQELSEATSAQSTHVLLGIEEPELYQHPPQARHLASVLESFSAHGQVVVCTHSPYFVSGQGFPGVRLLRRSLADGVRKTELSHASLDAVRELMRAAGGRTSISTEGTRIKLHQLLHPVANELFFAPIAVLVEGDEDLAHITTAMHLAKQTDQLRRLGCHIIPAHAKSRMAFLLAVATSLRIPTFAVFDGDADKCDTEPQRKAHESDNGMMLKLCGHAGEAVIPTENLWKSNLVMWKTNFTNVFRDDIGATVLKSARDKVREADGLSDADLNKSALFIGAVVEELWAAGRTSANLTRLCDQILKFAASTSQVVLEQAVAEAPTQLDLLMPR